MKREECVCIALKSMFSKRQFEILKTVEETDEDWPSMALDVILLIFKFLRVKAPVLLIPLTAFSKLTLSIVIPGTVNT